MFPTSAKTVADLVNAFVELIEDIEATVAAKLAPAPPPIPPAQSENNECQSKLPARVFGFSRQTLYKMRNDGQIEFGRMRGRAMVPMAEIKRLAAVKPAAPHVSEQPTQALDRKRRPKKVKLYPREAKRIL